MPYEIPINQRPRTFWHCLGELHDKLAQENPNVPAASFEDIENNLAVRYLSDRNHGWNELEKYGVCDREARAHAKSFSEELR